MFLLRLLGTAIAFGVVAFLIWQNWFDFINALKAFPASFFVIVILLALTSRMMVTTRWFVLLKVVEPQVNFWMVAKLSFVGLFTTNVLPSTIGGDVVKLGGAVRFNLDAAHAAASLVVDRLIGMTTMATFLPLGIMRMVTIRTSGMVVMSSSSGSFFTRLKQKLYQFLRRMGQALKLWLQQPLTLLIAAVLSYLHMICTFSMVWFILSGLGEPISWWTAGGLWVLVYFITLVPISINGLGLQEVSLSLIYATFAGVTESGSLVLALLMRVLFIIASLPGAFFLPGMLSGVSREVSSIEKEKPL